MDDDDQESNSFKQEIKQQSDPDEDTAIRYLVSSNMDREFASADKLLRKRHTEYIDEGSGNEKYSSKSKGKKYRKKRQIEEVTLSPLEDVAYQQYKLRTSVAIERERIRQRDEELRLKAIELKLRGDELRLKEAEMSKINTLAGVEEEKLKCWREMLAMMKELLEKTRNGTPANPRFLNII